MKAVLALNVFILGIILGKYDSDSPAFVSALIASIIDIVTLVIIQIAETDQKWSKKSETI